MIDQLLQQQLDPLASEREQWRRARDLARVWAASAVAVLVAAWAGRSGGLAASVLLPGVVLGAIVCTVRVWRRRAPRPDYAALARRIEAEHPELHALLRTAVEQRPEDGAGYHHLQQRVIDEAVRHCRQYVGGPSAGRLLYAQLARGVALAGLAAALVAGWLWSPPTALLAALRGAEAAGLEVTPGDTEIERGTPLVVLARFRGPVPDEVTLVIRADGQAERRVPLTRSLDDPLFGGTWPEVRSDLTYRIEPAGRGSSRDYRVGTFEFPRLERADARVVFPEYTRLPAKEIPDTRRVTAVEGSTIEYTLLLNKPVAQATLRARDGTTLPLTAETNRPAAYRLATTLDRSLQYDLLLVDEAGRTNKSPPRFVFEALSNRAPELRLVFPRGDQRVSALEEIAFEAEASDDFGLGAHGLAFSVGGGEPRYVELGREAPAGEKRRLAHLLPLEDLAVRPDQLITYFLWADDHGPDGAVRRTSSDLQFVEVRPFEEIYREGQGQSGESQGESQGEGQGGESEKLAELQKQIVNATWNLQRREAGARRSAGFVKDVGVIRDSQQAALDQLSEASARLQEPGMVEAAAKAEAEMQKALARLDEAGADAAEKALPPALAAEQAAYQALLSLQAREYQITQGRNQGRSGRSGQSRQRQIDMLDLKSAENRYETQRQARPQEAAGQKERVEVLNRLKELAGRQQDLNERFKELQSALQEAATEAEREEIRRRLKRLREEQQEMIADLDEVRQRADRAQDQAAMSESRERLDQARSEMQQSAEALGSESASQALAAGARAQQNLETVRDNLRKQSSSQFNDAMREMRGEARDLARRQEDISRQLDGLNREDRQKTLRDSGERREIARQMGQQKAGVTNLLDRVRAVSEQSETAEPLLSKQLYETYRQTNPGEINQSLDNSAELLSRGFVEQAGPFEERARGAIDAVRRGVERAAESVLGDDVEALRAARRELESLSNQLEREIANAQASATPEATGTRPAGSQTGQPGGRGEPQAGPTEGQAQADARAAGNRPGNSGSPDGQEPPNGQQAGNSQQAASGQRDSSTPSQRGGGQPGGGNRTGERLFFQPPQQQTAANGGGGAGGGGPLTGADFVSWADRLREVEEMLDVPELRGEVAQVLDRAQAFRQEFKRHAKTPKWELVQTQLAGPLVEVRTRIAEELARRENKEARVPLDRDPVPAKYSELVRRYYEQLGKGE